MTDTKSENATTSRRSFLKSGAIVGAPLAAVAVPAAAMADDGTKARLARLEDERAIEVLHRDVLRRFNAGDTVDGFDPGVSAIRPDMASEPAVPELTDDGSTARCSHACVVEIESELEGNSTLVQMARLQGNGVVRTQEKRTLHADYVKRGGEWVVASLRLG